MFGRSEGIFGLMTTLMGRLATDDGCGSVSVPDETSESVKERSV